MGELWSTLGVWLRKSAGAIAAVVAAILGVIVYRRHRQAPTAVEPDIDAKVGRRIEGANAEAKAKLEASAAEERRDVAELGEISEDTDEDRRRQALIDAMARAEKDGK
jgi:hypothetical protein